MKKEPLMLTALLLLVACNTYQTTREAKQARRVREAAGAERVVRLPQSGRIRENTNYVSPEVLPLR